MIFHILLPYLMMLDKNYSCELEKKNNDKFTIISFLIGKETKPLSLRRVRDPENFRDRSQRTTVSHGFSTNEGQQLDCFPSQHVITVLLPNQLLPLHLNRVKMTGIY